VAPNRFTFTAEVWQYDGPGGWHFVSVPEADTDEIEEAFGHAAKGFGSLRVDVLIGKTTWSTSIFPDRKRGTYLLPVKKSVREAEHLAAGTQARVQMVVVT
jgi:hypothetical protein